MKKQKFVVLLVVIMALVMGTAVVYAITIIDSFNDTTQTSDLATPCSTGDSPGSDINGGERNIFVERTSGGGTVVADTNDTYAGSFTFSVGASTRGNALIQWDGDDNVCTLNDRGLAPLSLAPDDGLTLYVRSVDQFATLDMRVYTSSAQYSTYTYIIPSSISSPGRVLYFPFESFTPFGGGADFTDVGAIELLINGSSVDSMDITLDFVNSDLTRDFGDLPTAYNNITLEGTNGARHVLGTVYLGNGVGSGVNADADGQPSTTATGDTLDDGVAFGPDNHWGDGSGSLNIKVTIPSGNACVLGWIDWNGNNTFDVGGTTGGVSELVFNGYGPNGTRTRTITTPTEGAYASGYPSVLNARFRVFEPNADLFTTLSIPLDDFNCPTLDSFNQGGTATEAEVAGLLTGIARNGEVEDYQWGFTPTAVNLQSFSADTDANPVVYVVMAFAVLVLMGGVVFVLRREQENA